MSPLAPLVDIHCHVLPAIDDGSKSWDQSLAMAHMASRDGIRTIIATPHQLGVYSHIKGRRIREAVSQLQQFLDQHDVPLTVLPGADIRVEPDMVSALCDGSVLTLADRRRHVLLELPHEMYVPLDRCLEQLADAGMVGILSHPERNQGLLRRPELILDLIAQGCLMQVTAGSLFGSFGAPAQEMAERMIRKQCVHFLATDAHGHRARRPLLHRALVRVAEMVGHPTALEICCENPSRVAAGREVIARLPQRKSPLHWWPWRRVA